MGFLDHSTNNIIIDAVLTDTGRKMLANNQGNFRIAFFSLADDEVDYSIIAKFGRAVGKEKISKNTPVFEAQTLGSVAVKHRMLTLPNPTIVRLPSLSLGEDVASDALAFSVQGQNQTKTVSVNQQISGEAKVPDGVSDATFTVLVPDRFVTVVGKNKISVEATTRIATYSITRDHRDPNTNAAKASFSMTVQPGLDDTIFSIYGASNNPNVIHDVCSVIGDQSGIRKDFTITISKT